MNDNSVYIQGDYPFPSQSIDPQLKLQPDYGLSWCKAIWSLYVRNQTSWGIDTTDYFNRMRRYSEGAQDSFQYRSWLKNQMPQEDGTSNEMTTIWDDNSYTKEMKRKGYDTIMFQNLSPASKILNSLHGLLDKVDYDIMADCVDADSRGLVEFMKYKQFHEAKDAQFQAEYKKKAGIPIDEQTSFPKTKEELDAFEAREGFKLNVAKSMQKLLRHSFHISKWDAGVRRKILDDLICTQYATAMDYFDDETQTFKGQWLDPAKVILQFSHEFDYSDSTYGGYYEQETIAYVRRKCPELTEETLVALAKNYKGRFGNPRRWTERYSQLDPATRGYGFDSWKITVFKSYWIDKDEHRSIYWKGKGSPRIIDIGYNSKVTPLTDKQKARGFTQDVKTTSVDQVYQCSWVVDSDIVFEFGKYHMAPRPEMTKAKLPIHAVQLLQPSIIFRLVPIFDHIAIAWLQFQNDLANMVQRGYAINMAMLMNVQMNGKDLDPAQILTLWKQKGLLPYMLSPNGNYTGGMSLPVTPIDGGLGKRVEETMATLEMYYKSIEDIVGINPLSLGASPDPKAPVSTSEAALRATSNVLKPIVDALFEVKESIAESLCLRIQIGLRVSDSIRKAYAGVVNPNDIRTMIQAEQSGTKYGIMLRVRPNEKQREAIVNYMNIAIQAGQITPPDAMYFSERIESGADITEIRQEIDYAIKKTLEEQQKTQQDNIDRQNQGLMNVEQTKAQLAQQQSVVDTQGKLAQQDAIAKTKLAIERTLHNYKMLDEAQAQSDMEDGLSTPNIKENK